MNKWDDFGSDDDDLLSKEIAIKVQTLNTAKKKMLLQFLTKELSAQFSINHRKSENKPGEMRIA